MVIFMRYKLLAVLFSLVPAISLAASPIYIPDHVSTICTDLATVTYWASTEHLSKLDKRNADEAVKSGGAANKQRNGIAVSRLQKARSMGAMSHGNSGNGLSNLESARQDGILAAIQTYESCLKGGL